MRFHLGAVPPTPDFVPESPWKPLREPTPWVMQLLALPIGIAATVGVGALWFLLTPMSKVTFDSPGMMLGACLAIIPVHELIHAAIHPHSGRSDASVLGLWPSRLLFYAHYLGELSRNRFLAILLMPLAIISFLPLLICAILGNSPAWLAFSSIVNALFACGDVFGAGLVAFQVPAHAVVRNQGYRTFWRAADGKAG